MKSNYNILICIPTYNEYENVSQLYAEIKKLPFTTDILFCDDNSPDGTGALIDQLVAQDSSVHVIHRPGKMGTGTAFIEAFKFAHHNHYTHLVTMDADFTHDPSYIIPMMEVDFNRYDIVIGSRYAPGGSMVGWSKVRLPFTYFWKYMIHTFLKMPYDCTGAFRVYQVPLLKPEIYTHIEAQGFAFCMESLYRFVQHGARITEIPITAHNRKKGGSKLSYKIMSEAAQKFIVLAWQNYHHKKKALSIK